MSAEDRVRKLGIEIPEAPAPLGSYIPVVRTGNLIFLSGMLPLVQGKLLRRGKVGDNITVEEAREDARTATINAFSALKAETGSLDRVKRCVRVTGYIASAPDFTEQPKVLNAASDLIAEILGEYGRHTRVAVGVSVLPLDSPVEIAFVFEV